MIQKGLEHMHYSISKELLQVVSRYYKASQEVLNELYTDGITYQEYFAQKAGNKMLRYFQELKGREPLPQQQEAFKKQNLQSYVVSNSVLSFWHGPYSYSPEDRYIRWQKTFEYVMKSIVTEMETITLYEGYLQEVQDNEFSKALSEIVHQERRDLADLNQMLFSLMERPPVVGVQHTNGLMHFTLAQLAHYNGIDGKPAYVAINGKVYDVTHALAWQEGSHFGLIAGRDLSNYFMKCHSGQTMILESLPMVGTLVNNMP